jgi:hypothetical protein
MSAAAAMTAIGGGVGEIDRGSVCAGRGRVRVCRIQTERGEQEHRRQQNQSAKKHRLQKIKVPSSWPAKTNSKAKTSAWGLTAPPGKLEPRGNFPDREIFHKRFFEIFWRPRDEF